MSHPHHGEYIRRILLLREEVPSFDEYPFSLQAVRHLDELPLHPGVTFIIGENGTGKSTLLEAIAMLLRLNPEGGSRNLRFATLASHSSLCDYLRFTRGRHVPKDVYFLRAESFFNLATEIDRLDREDGGRHIIRSYGGSSLHEQSHGESFYALFKNRFEGCGLYLLDEPEAALSPIRQTGFLCLIRDLVQNYSQFIIATHSPIIMAYPDAWIYQLSSDGITRIAYQDTEHYRVSKQFLEDPERMLALLFNDQGPA